MINDSIIHKQILQCFENIDVLFTGRDDKAADSCEEPGAIKTSETTRDLLFDFHHSDVSLGKVFVEWHFKIVEESQNIVCVIFDAFYEVSRLCFFLSASFLFRRRFIRVGFKAFLYQILVEASIPA